MKLLKIEWNRRELNVINIYDLSFSMLSPFDASTIFISSYGYTLFVSPFQIIVAIIFLTHFTESSSSFETEYSTVWYPAVALHFATL